MVYNVLLDKTADKFLEKLMKSDKNSGMNILKVCIDLKNFSEKSSNTKKLHTPFEGFRIRVGKYRILFVVNDKKIEIYKIGLRKDVYSK